MRRWIIWSLLTGLTGVLGGSAGATPMNNKDYASQIQLEVDYQNMTCAEFGYLEAAFTEMLGRCPPADPFGGAAATVAGPVRQGSTSRPPPIVMPNTYTPPRRCPDGTPPTYPLSPTLYAQFGPSMRAQLQTAGVPWDVDMEQFESNGRPRSSPQTYVSGVISSLEHQLATAAALKNCKGL